VVGIHKASISWNAGSKQVRTQFMQSHLEISIMKFRRIPIGLPHLPVKSQSFLKLRKFPILCLPSQLGTSREAYFGYDRLNLVIGAGIVVIYNEQVVVGSPSLDSYNHTDIDRSNSLHCNLKHIKPYQSRG